MNYVKTALLLSALTAVFLAIGWLVGGAAGAMLAFVAALGMNAYAFWNSDKQVLSAYNAEPVTRANAPDLLAMVEDLSRRADLPTPRVYIIREDQPNAFATGRNPENAAVAATTGLLQMLNRDEIAGVMAHELAHVKNRDTLVMTVSATVAGAISMIARFAFFFRGGSRNMLAGIVAAIFAPMAAMVIQAMISRTREYAADRLGAQITGDPMALASALSRISGAAARSQMDRAEANPATAHMFIVNPLAGLRFDRLFATHPPAEVRIARLTEMAGEPGMQGGSRVQASSGDFGRPRKTGGRRTPTSEGPWS